MLSSNHSLLDDRIYWKEAVSLSKNGYEVCHIGIGTEAKEYITPEGIKLIEIPFSQNSKAAVLLKRADSSYQKIFEHAKKEKAAAYQFHDWQLNIIGKQLKSLPHKPKVIYDAHEATADMILSEAGNKANIKKIIAFLFSAFIRRWELRAANNYDHIITAEDSVATFFGKKVPPHQITCIHNYSYFLPANTFTNGVKKYHIIYSGSLSAQRGIIELLEAISIAAKSFPNIKTLIIGSVNEHNFKEKILEKIKAANLESNVELMPAVPFSKIKNFYMQSEIGICGWHLNSKNINAIPIKIFEYMAFGLPVIFSNQGIATKYITEYNTGILVNPYNPHQIAEAILSLLNNKVYYDELSANGKKAITEKYNWQNEEQKLLNVYRQLFS